jgi:hypothetical protein
MKITKANSHTLSIPQLRELADRPDLQSIVRGTNDRGLIGYYVPAPLHGRDPLEILLLGWAVEWKRLAFPIIETRADYLAALAATTPPDDVVFMPPWPAFLTCVPGDLIHVTGHDTRLEAIRRIAVASNGAYWSLLAIGERGTTLSVFNSSNHALRESAPVATVGDIGAFIPLDSIDERALATIKRIVVNLSIVMSDPSRARPVGDAHHRGSSTTPDMLPGGTYHVSKPVRVDCREAVRSYITGKRSSLPTVRWLVRGHWRNQAHGPARSMRTLKWIEPHWKGEPDAPVVERPHVIAQP